MLLYTETLFILLFAALWCLTGLLRPWPIAREWVINLFSLFIIGTWGLFGLKLFLCVLIFNYAGVSLMVRLSGYASKTLLRFLIVANLCILAVFKYSSFFASNVALLTGWEIPTFALGLPIAISFYTFHIISYLVDVHRGKTKPTGLRGYLFYLSFFPHVVAGPIVRAWQLLPQIGKVRRVPTDTLMGLHYFSVGFFLKCFCANHIAQGIDPIWKGTAGFIPSLPERWLVAIFYYFQIYADFAGYSLMALGMARFMGYRLPPNFRGPMLAKSLQEFWQRWHITLSRWLRDYLYIPLGGNRVPPWHAAINVMITMLLGGLWHGAGWGFVIWGGMHGLGIVLGRFFRGSVLWIYPWILTQVWVTLAWIFFRSETVAFACDFIRGMFSPEHGWQVHSLIASLVIFLIPVIAHHHGLAFLKAFGKKRMPIVIGVMTGVLIVVNIITLSPAKTFIYFKF